MNIDLNLKIFSFNWKVSINKQWVQFGIIMTVILVSMIVSYWGSTQILILLLVVLAGLAMILALIQQPNLGFILIFLSGVYFSYTMDFYEIQFGGMNVVVAIVALLLCLWFFDMLVVKREFRFIKSRVIFPVLMFFVISVLAFGMGQIPWFVFARQAPFSAQLGGFFIYTLSIGALMLSAHLIRNTKWLQIIVWIYIGLGFFYLINRLFNTSLQGYFHPAFFGSMFWTWIVVLSFGQAVFNTQLKPIVRGLLFGIVLTTFYVAIGQGADWKSGWIPPLVSAGVVLMVRFKSAHRFIIPIGLIFVLLVSKSLIDSMVTSEDYSWGTRLDAWKIVLEISRISPIFGMGYSNYYWYTPLFPIRGWSVSFNSHSQYVDLIAQSGYLGLLCFFWVLFEVGRLSWALSKKLPNGFAQAYANSVFAGIIGTLVAGYLGDWVLPFVYNIGLTGFRASIVAWIFMGGVISLEQMYLSESTV